MSTVVQAYLFEDHEVLPIKDEDLTIGERFYLFHQANPWVYTELIRILTEKKHRGFRQYGIGAAYEELRWSGTIRTNGNPYKLNNDYRALYARKIIEESPAIGEMLSIRERRTP